MTIKLSFKYWLQICNGPLAVTPPKRKNEENSDHSLPTQIPPTCWDYCWFSSSSAHLRNQNISQWIIIAAYAGNFWSGMGDLPCRRRIFSMPWIGDSNTKHRISAAIKVRMICDRASPNCKVTKKKYWVSRYDQFDSCGRIPFLFFILYTFIRWEENPYLNIFLYAFTCTQKNKIGKIVYCHYKIY